ncbi:hypothetical protein NDU88_003354 [Pleurodeles waltl]|uniref:Uncharacterized protein n=1 Tax=Pleurodeles waltl TaxID=8319 RepID=A0AAV7MQA8_PLEWA|nr:hypothetical protein NDU88_003354 [Pleurodeles waltl]
MVDGGAASVKEGLGVAERSLPMVQGQRLWSVAALGPAATLIFLCDALGCWAGSCLGPDANIDLRKQGGTKEFSPIWLGPTA